MTECFPGLLAAFLVAMALVPVLARGAFRLGLVDTPSARSMHSEPVPRVGGIAVLVGLFAGLTMVFLTFDATQGWGPYIVPLVLYFAIGLADDVGYLSTRRKLFLQIVAAASAVMLGLRWGGDAIGPFAELRFGWMTPHMTALWLFAVVMLVNFVDGIDLITSTVAVVVLGAAAGGGAGPAGGFLYAVAAAAVLGMVVWNVTPARVFPGDSATHMLGFLMAAAACGVPSGDPLAPVTAALPWAAASAPLLPGVIDVAMGIYGKVKRGVPVHAAHSDHLYQRLTKIGWTHAGSALRYGVLALVALALVTRVAPAYGLLACVGVSVAVLIWHLAGGWSATRRVPWGASANGDSA